MSMKKNKFRLLRADEIECKIGNINKAGTGLSLFLYKDARCDMAVLDESVGSLGWQREHYECKGNLFCKVGLKDEDGTWVWKSDAGIESSKTDKSENYKKGEASDSFKRACFNWGIGRELYTSPFIWVTNATIKDGKCYDKFQVEEIDYDDNNKITKLVIYNLSKKCESFRMGKAIPKKKFILTDKMAKDIDVLITETGSNKEKMLEFYGISNIKELSETDYNELLKILNGKKGAK